MRAACAWSSVFNTSVGDSASRALEYRAADRFGLHRQIANRGADRHATSDHVHDGPGGCGIDRAKRALCGILQVDDVGAGEKRGLGFGHVAHAGKEEGHSLLLNRIQRAL